MKKFSKIAGLIIFALALIPSVYLASAYMLSRICTEYENGSTGDVSVFIRTNGVHTDLIVPLKNGQADWSKDIRFEHTTGKDTIANFVAFGWGNKAFYLETPTWADLKFTTAFTAAFGMGNSALHTTFYKEVYENENCRKIMLSRQQYMRLAGFIKGSFTQDKNGHAQLIKTSATYGTNDAFYEANGRYSLFHTCNTWANNGLKACGQKAGLWTPFDTGIFYHYSQQK